jgi:DNA-binding CsgD family transcriptional regulator
LQQLIARAAGTADGTPPSGGTLRVARPSAHPYVVLALPLSSTVGDVLQLPSGVLLVLADPDLVDQPSITSLEEVFGLTPAEAAVAVRILGGHGLQSVAGDLGVTLSTVRIHLQRVFEKTETHRQAEPVRFLINLRPTLPP